MRNLGIPFLVLALLFSSASFSQEEKKAEVAAAFLGDAELLKILDEAITDVEKAAGIKFKTKPAIKSVGISELYKTSVEELSELIQVAYPDESPKNITRVVKQQLTGAAFLVGKYAIKTHTIMVNTEAFRMLPFIMERQDLFSRKILKGYIVHETVHALDEDAYSAFSRRGEHLKKGVQLDALSALNEGHAQAVTKRAIADALTFLDIEEAMLGDSLTAPKYGVNSINEMVKLLYYEGRLFWEAVGDHQVADIFGAPPKSVNIIRDPKKY